MTHYIKSGATFHVSPTDAIDLHPTLPVGTYTVGQNPQTGEFYLDMVDSFSLSGKIYGDTEKTADRILNTFNSRTQATGVMLSGEKGSGKTLLARMLAVKAAEKGVATILINRPWYGDAFNRFMQTIAQPTLVLFDEFEKVYNREQQEQMLTLLDGVYQSKKLFVLTCNDKYRVDSHMVNCPGRIFYHLTFKGVSQDFIREYCADNLKNPAETEGVCQVSVLFEEFNFDILKALVEEMNRYDESAKDAMAMLNARPESSGDAKWEIFLTVGGLDIEQKMLADRFFYGDPLDDEIVPAYKVFIENEEDEPEDNFARLELAVTGRGRDNRSWDWKRPEFYANQIVKINAAEGEFVFVNEEGSMLRLVKQKKAVYHMAF